MFKILIYLAKKSLESFLKMDVFLFACLRKLKKALYQNDVIKILLTVCAERWDGSKTVS